MRVSEYEVESIKTAVREHFGDDAQVYLFGSRTDDRKRGGDIDLLVETPLQGKELVRAKLAAMSSIQMAIGDRKIDIVTAGPDEREDEPRVVRIARETGVAL